MHFRRLFFTCACLAAVSFVRADTATLTIHADRPGPAISPMLYGIFFEEINRAGDGGLYAEMIQNRSFEDGDEPVAWKIEGTARIDRERPLNEKNPRSLRLAPSARIANEGFNGLAVRGGETYIASFYARGDAQAKVIVSLESNRGERLAIQEVTGLALDWRHFKCFLYPTADVTDARLVIDADSAGTVWLDVVSLFPQKTWKNHGLRSDLAEKIEAMKPAFIRFPGGCWVEGESLDNAYRWKQTIGPIEQRRNQYNLWKYHSTHGLGYHEYLQLCEDLGAEPLFVINCGMSHKGVVPMELMDEWVQDALDAIEYANGSIDTEWGAARAKNGHPAPFHLEMIQVGNENGGKEYDDRYALFYDAIKAKHPQVKVLANLWQGKPSSRPIEILDEHYYNNPAFFIANANRYDSYDRKGPKIYVGEYAVTQGCGQGNLRAAVAEAAFMAGMERNSDVVVMGSYAPLFANVHYKVWNPDAINFDASRSYGTPSYHVQTMLAQNRADVVLPIEMTFADARSQTRHGAVGLGTWATHAEFKDIKVTRDGEVLFSPDTTKDMAGWRAFEGKWRVVDGVLRQAGDAEGTFAIGGDAKWSDYVYTLKARKLRGKEGFLIGFHWLLGNNMTWWNLGGWGNSKHALEVNADGAKSIIGNEVPGRIEQDRWYDIRIETLNDRIRCFLDGQLMHEATYPRIVPLHGVAGRKGDDVIVKIANVSPRPQETDVRITGVQDFAQASAIVLTSASPDDENSFEQPAKVSPVTAKVDLTDGKLHFTFPPHSVTVLRVSTAAK